MFFFLESFSKKFPSLNAIEGEKQISHLGDVKIVHQTLLRRRNIHISCNAVNGFLKLGVKCTRAFQS